MSGGWRDFGTSRIPGVKRQWADDGEGGGVVRTVQDVTAIIERNKAMYNHNDGYSKSREMRRVASIPAVTWHKWMVEAGLDARDPDLSAKMEEVIKRKVNDPDFRYFRTAPGRL